MSTLISKVKLIKAKDFADNFSAVYRHMIFPVTNRLRDSDKFARKWRGGGGEGGICNVITKCITARE